MDSNPDAWASFAGAMVAGASALVGLVFVSLSINVNDILTMAGISDVALEGIGGLTAVLIAAIVVATPGQAPDVLALELLVVGMAELGLIVWLCRRTLRVAEPQFRGKRLQMAATSGAPGVLFAIAGVALWTHGPGGLYWLVPASVFGIVAGIVNAWVLLIEIKR